MLRNLNFRLSLFLSKNLYLCFFLILIVLIGCGTRIQKATAGLIDEAEARWRTKAISSYRMVVDVQMSGDVRRNEITVQNSRINQATVSYKDSGRWARSQKLNESQALAFTVPGLFETVREEIRANARSDIRVAFNRDRAYLERVVLGPVLQKNEPIPNSEVYIFVRKFEPLSAGS